MTEKEIAVGLLRFAHRFLVRQTMPRYAVDYYDALIASVSDFYLRPFRDEVLGCFPSSATILDIGTGPGHLPVMLAQANPAYRIVGVDLSEAVLRAARRRAADAELSDQVEFRRVDIEKDASDLPHADLAISACSLHHWRYPVRMLRAISNLLKPGGQIWILDDCGETSNEARKAWVERVEKAANAGWVFRTVFRLESRYLAYTRSEFEAICGKSALELVEFKCRDVFFLAKIRAAK